MAHTFTDVFVHCIFSTKDRRDIIPSHLQSEMWAYIHGIAKNLNVHTLAVGGTGNHSRCAADASADDKSVRTCSEVEVEFLAVDG